MATAYIKNLSLTATNNNVVDAAILVGSLPNTLTFGGTILQATNTKTATLGNTSWATSSTANFANATVSNAALTTSGTNTVQGGCVNSGTIPNAVTFQGTVNQAATSTTANLGNTTWVNTATVNMTGTTISNASLLGANTNTVDNASLPSTITRTLANTTSVSTPISYLGNNTNFGTLKYSTSKNYTGAASNAATSTVATITLNAATTFDWFMCLRAIGASTTSGYSATGEWIINKRAGSTAADVTYGLASVSDSTQLSPPDISWNGTTGALTVLQNPGTNISTSDGNVLWTVVISDWVGLKGNPAIPTLS